MHTNKARWIVLFCFFFMLGFLSLNGTTFFRLKLADYYMETQNYDKAASVYEKILRKEILNTREQTLENKHITEVFPILVNLLLNQERAFDAARMFKRVKEISPDQEIESFPEVPDSSHYRKFGLCLLKVGLKDEAIKQFQNALTIEPDDFLAQYQIALIYQEEGMEEKAAAQFVKIAELLDESADKKSNDSQNYKGDIYYNAGLRLENEGNAEKAKSYYRKAIELDGERIIDAYYRLNSLHEKEGKEEYSESIENALMNLKPEYEINHRFPNGLILLGYSMNEKEFELFNKGKITFFWEVPGQKSKLDHVKKGISDIYKIEGRLFEVRETENLAPNFGFEIDPIAQVFPNGWGFGIYGELKNREIVFDSMPFKKSQCLMLDNTTAPRTACRTHYIPVDKDTPYLQGGWIKSVKGNAYLGRRWFDSKKVQINFNFTVKGIHSSKWRYYAGIVTSPANSAYCRLWMLNFRSQGKVYFDEIIFVKLQLPV